MPSSDWTIYTIANNTNDSEGIVTTDLAAGGGAQAYKIEKTSGALYHGQHFRYSGADVGQFPTKFCTISMAVKGIGLLPTLCQYGAYFNAFSFPAGNQHQFGIRGAGVVIRQEDTVGGASLAGGAMQDGSVLGSPVLAIPVVDNDWVQFEAACLMNELYKEHDYNASIHVWARYNGGTSLSLPGSAGWSDWNHIALVQPGYFGHDDFQNQNGMHPAFGFAACGAFAGGTPGDGLIFDHVTVRYGAYTP